MSYDPRSDETSKIVHALAGMPGCTQINVTAKRYPRFGPHEAGTTYLEQTQLYSAHNVPEHLEIPEGAEEVLISLNGSLGEPVGQSDLVGQLSRSIEEVGMFDRCEVRAELGEIRDAGRTFHAEVMLQ